MHAVLLTLTSMYLQMKGAAAGWEVGRSAADLEEKRSQGVSVAGVAAVAGNVAMVHAHRHPSAAPGRPRPAAQPTTSWAGSCAPTRRRSATHRACRPAGRVVTRATRGQRCGASMDITRTAGLAWGCRERARLCNCWPGVERQTCALTSSQGCASCSPATASAAPPHLFALHVLELLVSRLKSVDRGAARPRCLHRRRAAHGERRFTQTRVTRTNGAAATWRQAAGRGREERHAS